MIFEDLAAYTRDMADRMGLRDWTVNLEVGDTDGCAATQYVAWGTNRVTVTLSPEWATWSPDDLRVTLVHELVHCHLIRMMWSFNSVVGEMYGSGVASNLASRGFHTDHEVATEAIATAWAETLPLPIRDESEDAA